MFFSKGDDDVYACVYSNDLINVTRYYNFGRSPSRQTATGITNTRVSLSNGILSCSFTRLISVNTIPYFADLSNRYYLLTVAGPTDSAGNIQFHSTSLASNDQIYFLAGGDYTGADEERHKTKAQGIIF